jgi:hypothetical protein
MTIKTKAGQGQALFASELDANFASLHEMNRGTGLPVKVAIDSVTPDWGWRDLTGTLRIFLSTAVPDQVAYLGNIPQAQFKIGDNVTFEFHVPHDYVPGTDMFIHAHWSHNSSIVTTGSVNWQFEMTSAKGHGTDSFYTPVIINVPQAAHTTRYQHMIAEGQCSSIGGAPAATLLDTDWIEVDSLILCMCKLTANTMDGLAKPFLHSVDLHYQSSNRATRNKAPNFYA